MPKTLEQAARELLDAWNDDSSQKHLRRCFDELRAALSTETVSVPMEPTEAMLAAGWQMDDQDGTPRDVWVAMLAAHEKERNDGC